MENELYAVAHKACKFIETYTRYYDSDDIDQRIGQLRELYVPGVSYIEWNGHSSDGHDNVQDWLVEVLRNIPPTKHTLISIDAQPLPASNEGDHFVISVTGKVTYGGQTSKLYSQTLTVRQHEAKYYIVTDQVRWLAER